MVPIRRPFCLGWLQQIVSQQKQQRFHCFFDLVSEKTAKRYTDIFSLPFFVEINAWWHHARDVMLACNELMTQVVSDSNQYVSPDPTLNRHQGLYRLHKGHEPWHPHRAPGARLYKDTQVFLWHTSQSTTTQRQMSLPLEPVSEHQGADYTHVIT